MSEAAVAAVDWGTSSLRLWLLDREGDVLTERRSGEGMQSARTTGFELVLERMLTDADAPADLPVIVCGMAGARQGWVEAPYAELPATLDDVFRQTIRVPGIARDVRIVPGIAQRRDDAPDVMRGEETQIAGALAKLGDGPHVVCMPGTHSKWVQIDKGVVAGFTTWMTGELFDTFANHTILTHSIGDAAGQGSAQDAAFTVGLQQGLEHPERLTSMTFGIRAATLLQGLTPADAAGRLSGLLLGAEIGAARALYLKDAKKVVLVASGALRSLYAKAFDLAGLGAAIVDADEAVRAGLLQAARINGLLPEGRP